MKSDNDKYIRMTLNERVQHFLLLSSFIILVITGFWLKYPEAWWVRWITILIGENAFNARSLIHRIAAVAMVVTSVYHIIYLAASPRGRKLFMDFLPKRSDLSEFGNSMKYLFGNSAEKPRFGRFSYIEKMEYWAVVWGTVIMGATGFILWFKDYFFKYISNTGMEIATAIHFYEAILASLAILVWHFYFVFLNPDVYPVNKAWVKGYLTRHQMEHEHPQWLEEIENKESVDGISENREPNIVSENTKPDKKEELTELKTKTDKNKKNELHVGEVKSDVKNVTDEKRITEINENEADKKKEDNV